MTTTLIALYADASVSQCNNALQSLQVNKANINIVQYQKLD